MSTRGLYGFRKNGVDKTTYNHCDSYPEGLGSDVVKFCLLTPVDVMERMFQNIELVSEGGKPTEQQIMRCKQMGIADFTVNTCREDDWYCLLRNLQGDLFKLREFAESGVAYMIDNSSFILDSLFCEHAYIINLDTKCLEYYTGFQKKPQQDNRYGTENRNGYYPCRLAAEIPLEQLSICGDNDTVKYLASIPA